MHASHFLSIPTPNALSSSYRSATFPLRPSPRTLNLLHSGSFQHESPFPGVTFEARHWHAAICLGLHEAIKSVPLIQTVFLFSNLKLFSTLLFCQKRRDGVLTSQTWDSHGRDAKTNIGTWLWVLRETLLESLAERRGKKSLLGTKSQVSWRIERLHQSQQIRKEKWWDNNSRRRFNVTHLYPPLSPPKKNNKKILSLGLGSRDG